MPDTDGKFLANSTNTYTFLKNGKQFIISTYLICSLFYIHGCFVDPSDHSKCLSESSIDELKNLAIHNNDTLLLSALNESHSYYPSPLHINLTDNNISSHIYFFQKLLEIGLYLGGWNGPTEPYINTIKPLSDLVTTDIKVSNTINQIKSLSCYEKLSSIVLIRTRDSISNKLDQLLELEYTAQNFNELSVSFILTSNYYLSSIYGIPQIALEPLITHLLTDSSILTF